MTINSNNRPAIKPGDRVIATDSSGVKHAGHLDHENPCGQFYVLPDGPRQPFYAFKGSLEPTGDRQEGFSTKVHDSMGLSSLYRQELYIRHRNREVTAA